METLAQGWVGWFVASFLGLSVGSFANVAVFRIPREGLGVSKPSRSFCPACDTQLLWYENIPLISWIVLRGRCRSCSVRIPVRYPAIELLVGLLFVGFWAQVDPAASGAWGLLLVAWVMASLCVIVSAIDLEHFIIPDVITLPGIPLGLLLSLLYPALHESHVLFRPESPASSSLIVGLAGAVAGGGSLWLVGALGNLMLRRQIQEAGVEDAMGLGDVKWMAFAGTILGPLHVLEAILVACFAGALVGIAMKVAARVGKRDAPVGIPFGPFLSVGILIELADPGAAWAVMSLIHA
jgi:leader peptidase (prepilin peptidase)/N-methyltransferase